MGAATLLYALMPNFQEKDSAWDFYNLITKEYKSIQKVEFSELETELEALVKKRNDCYGSHSELSSRLSDCRKHYLSDILALARQNIKSAPSLGKFMLCVRECPLTYSMCRGAESDEANPDVECSIKEVQCIEACLDLYWRGTD